MRFALALLLALGLADPLAPGVGDHAPALDLLTIDGRPFTPASLEGGVTIVDFSATWCGPCHAALADLAAVEARLPTRARLIIVAVGEDPPTVKRFVAAHPLPAGAELALDRDRVTARAWGQERFPTTFLVDATGTIRHINRGWGSGYAERMSRWLRAMIAPRP
ncbi:MAG TPA: TlpA disulfide reductase family protein [Polyangia bacterium]|jgi:thiol-disulfide isomerase/thioredoxin|nr:TlpA disulfide reductase family protein [Polyangia bacterium]